MGKKYTKERIKPNNWKEGSRLEIRLDKTMNKNSRDSNTRTEAISSTITIGAVETEGEGVIIPLATIRDNNLTLLIK